ncbi:sugar transferase [Palleronia sediminis]|uniref:Sugar transferase n=1 Tax=Palleronia sediminis TaxID=2547833 RepID=A0A4V3B9N2_9RHOB|nr:sugar transferase [Palleronia sediminis]TDL79859.1 sugar transferase [Palleronia sediminis]
MTDHAAVAAPLAGPSVPFYARAGKRGLDIALALLLAPLVAPLVGFLWLLVRLDGGPGFFGHGRVGQDGRAFRCWKLRSMRPDADAALARLLRTDPAARAEWARSYRLARDPRVTPLGRVLRRLHLDELPQLWCVLRGDMSFVGPRPVTSEELALYGEAARAYLALRPGITGPWQLQGRDRPGFAHRIAADRDYGAAMGPLADLRMIVATGTRLLPRIRRDA